MMKPIAPDIKNPLYDAPVRPDMPKQTLNPRQVRDQAIASAKDARQQAMQAARAMEAGGQRLAAKKAALGDYNKARQTAQQQYQQTKLGPRTGGDMLRPGGMKAGGKAYKAGGLVSASKRADGCAVKGKTRGRIV